MSIKLVKDYHSNGQKKNEWHWNYNSEGRGMPTGAYKSWYESGAKESESVNVNLDDTLYMCTEWKQKIQRSLY
jgi:antitoxin component YwqK of YwqJK toxin-antitoxin module